MLEEGDVLLLAQHREDQMETVMLQLFRGAGVQGLSGMPVKCAFGAGQMCRPLLDVSQQEINDYYSRHLISSDLLELRNLADVAELIITSALQRKESRGLHYILDYPETDKSQPAKDTFIAGKS